jgi:type I restriction enzyme R subunit
LPTPEERARQNIDRMLAMAGWNVQDMGEFDLSATRGVAIREFPLKSGFADYMLFVDGHAAGVVEAKKEGTSLSGTHACALPGAAASQSAVSNPQPVLFPSVDTALVRASPTHDSSPVAVTKL